MKISTKSILATSLIALSMSLAIPQFAFAQDMSEAVEAYQADDYASAFPVFQALADQGDANAMWYLAQSHYRGRGTAESNALAFKWWEKSAKLGDKDSQSQMGKMYDRGHGVKKDQKQAFEWYLKSAENGRLSAMNEVGDRYYNDGFGVKKSKKEAGKWYRKGAEGGHGGAQANYGFYFELGYGGLRKSHEKALYWYRLSAEQGTATGQAYLGEMYESGNGVPEDLVEARRLYELAAAQDNKYAKARLKKMGATGKTSAPPASSSSGEMSAEDAVAFMNAGIEKSLLENAARLLQAKKFEKSLKAYHKLATEYNNARAQYFVGAHHELGWGTPQSWEKAVKWTRMGAEGGNPEAQFGMGLYYMNGNSVISSDYDKGVEWIKKAARNGHKEARETLTRNRITW